MRQKSSRRGLRLREPTDDFVLKTLVPFVLLVLASGPAGGWGEAPVWVNVLACLTLAGLFAMLVRTWRMGVYLRPSDIEIVGVWSRKTVEWQEIAEFTVGYPEGRIWKWAPVAVLADGSRLPMHAIQAPQPWTRPDNDFDSRAVAKLTQLLEKSRANDGSITKPDLDFERRLGF